MTIKHKRISGLPSDPTSQEIQPSDWNDDHMLDGFLALIQNASAQAGTLFYFNAQGAPTFIPISNDARGMLNTSPLAAVTAPPGTNTTQLATTEFVTAALAAIAARPPSAGHLSGLALSTAGSSATFAVAKGVATDSTVTASMTLASAISKTTAAWAVGSGNGGLDSGAIANNTWYHAHLIKRADTNVVDVLVSTSATTPALPSGYTLARRIGSMKTNGSSQWIKFIQLGDDFLWDQTVLEVNGATGTTTDQVVTLTGIPTGIQVQGSFSAMVVVGSGGAEARFYFSSLDKAAEAIGNQMNAGYAGGGASSQLDTQLFLRTSVAAQIRYRAATSQATLYLSTHGFVDRRGRDG